MCEGQTKSVISESLLRKLELKVAQSNEPNSDFCLGLPGWCPCLSCSPPEPPTVMNEELKQNECDEQNEPSLKPNDGLLCDAIPCPRKSR